GFNGLGINRVDVPREYKQLRKDNHLKLYLYLLGLNIEHHLILLMKQIYKLTMIYADDKLKSERISTRIVLLTVH
ncbi:hypothetical protein GJ496_006622, partial [Pomphorhynchus laevis]